MRRFIFASIVTLVGLILPGAASAATAYAVGTTNMRAGPGTNYPVVARIGGGSRVQVYGCVRGYSWCDSNVRGFRGWIAASRLEFVYRGARVLVPDYYDYFDVPIITFNFGYWDRYYRDFPFFVERYRYDRGFRAPPRAASPPLSGPPGGRAPLGGPPAFRGGPPGPRG